MNYTLDLENAIVRYREDIAEVGQQLTAANARIAELEAQVKEANDALNYKVEIAPDDLLATMLARAEKAEAQLAAKESTIADLRDLAYNRAPTAMAEEANKKLAEVEAQLAEAEKKLCAEQAEHTREVLRHAVTTARAEKAEAQLAEAGKSANVAASAMRNMVEQREKAEQGIDIARQYASRLEAALKAVKKWFEADSGPLAQRWHGGEISCVGMYQQILAALGAAKEEE